MVNFSKIKKLYFVGIKGIAMTALAVWAKEQHIEVSGSDTSEQFPSDSILSKKAISVLAGFDEKHISMVHPDAVIYTGAHLGRDNIEVKEAERLRIPALPHGIALGLAMDDRMQISVAGSHGKTTTSAMIAAICMHAGIDPSYAIGSGEIRGLGFPGHFGKGKYFIAEADEYITDPAHDRTPRFLWQHPDILVVTNIDYDHPDAYASLADVKTAFRKLQEQQQGSKITIVNYDDPNSTELLYADGSTILTYGESGKALYRAVHISYHDGTTSFEIHKHSKMLGTCALHVPGKHNVYDALASFVACETIGIKHEVILDGLAKFGGAKRRFETIETVGGVTYYDDYAHHPKEIEATISAMRGWYPKDRLIAVFQPHTYSRTKSLLSDFGKAFNHATIAVCTDIYASAREHDTMGIDGNTLVAEIRKHQSHVVYAPGKAEILQSLRELVQKGDRVIFMGAGNIYQWGKEIVTSMKSL
jgi:UDP-N-acetylmuramate--alanine ligase